MALLNGTKGRFAAGGEGDLECCVILRAYVSLPFFEWSEV